MRRSGILIGLGFCLSLGIAAFYISRPTQEGNFASSAITAQDSRHSSIQQVFDNRCVVCHSCNNAPCQVNLTSYSGLRRGATQTKVYEATRQKAANPTRLDIDAHSEKSWREKTFFSILSENDPAHGLLARTISEKAPQSEPLPPPAISEDVCSPAPQGPVVGMPYGLPELSQSESHLLLEWIQRGAPGSVPRTALVSSEEQKTLLAWESFLNDPSSEKRLVARYLYEHLFLAHVHFSNTPKQFFRLIRSRSSCSNTLSEIATRRPNDDPGIGGMYYCFKPLQQTIVEKTHLPYLMNDAKLQWMQSNFFSEPWSVSQLPSYEPMSAANPFVTFDAIPAKARYQFLLEDSQYHVATFIKGPVCNGTMAVNSIDDQFYVFFMDPNSDLMVKDAQFREVTKHLLVVPAEMGSNGKLLDLAGYFSKYPPLRNKYRQRRADAIHKNFPQGLALENIWNGNNNNDNGMLTVLRHDDNSYVLKGPRGDASKSAFVLDYALFERLVYNLVVGFDVYGNLTHQLHTRVYMGMIRMEGESNFLDFFPPALREPIRKDWYSPTMLAALEKKLIDSPIQTKFLTKVNLDTNLSPGRARAQMYLRILTERLPYIVKRFPDPINWKSLSFPYTFWARPSLSSTETEIAKLSVPHASGKNGWVRRMPDTALLMVKSQGQVRQVYTLIKNKKFKSEGSLLFEGSQRTPQFDDLMVLPGLAASYPNYFFVVEENEVPSFVANLTAAAEEPQWKQTLDQWGLSRSNKRFWPESDLLQSFMKRSMGLEGGVIDYTHYDIWTE
ncbi:fatty acid cis/trans isomerase [Bdellovibrio sp. HCB337]|uniref:fatty acid cis/trans isomerase n=1 Tax=Bdellovibrio sp. HCB337 TaxID=3394358 RepID=UPI0039A597D3